jgi:hypothetical protein
MNNNKILMIASGAVITGIILMLGIILAAIQLTEPDITSNITNNPILNENVEDEMDHWLSKLARFEYPGDEPYFKRLDSNGKYSYGCLQFQAQTFTGMAQKYNITKALGSASAIYDCSIQKEIARAMFEDDATAASHHWYTSIYVKGLGMPPDS